MKITLADLYQELLDLEERIKITEQRLLAFAKSDDTCKRLQTIPGVGPMSATTIVAATPDPHHFKNGRQFAA